MTGAHSNKPAIREEQSPVEQKTFLRPESVHWLHLEEKKNHTHNLSTEKNKFSFEASFKKETTAKSSDTLPTQSKARLLFGCN